MRSLTILAATTLHEICHAIAANDLGFRVTRIIVSQDARVSGQTEWHGGGASPRDRLIVALAGCVGECIATGRSFTPFAEAFAGDLPRALAAAGLAPDSGPEALAALPTTTEAVCSAYEILHRRWDEVLDLNDRLLEEIAASGQQTYTMQFVEPRPPVRPAAAAARRPAASLAEDRPRCIPAHLLPVQYQWLALGYSTPPNQQVKE